jgi:hypothetical protein
MLVTDPAQRADLLNQLGVDDRFLTDLTERADLTRLPGIGPAYAELLSKAGIRSVGALAAVAPAGLLETLTKTAATFGIKKLPTETELSSWVDAAKQTPDLVTWSTGVRVDGTKKLFAEDEWMKLRLAPLAAASLVMLASPSKGFDAKDEVAAVAASVETARKNSPAWSLVNVAFPKELTAADVQKFTSETPPAAMMSTIKAAGDVVAAKAPDQAAAYKALVMLVATHVAEASKEGGFLGMGKKTVSDKEAAALAELRSALGL